MTAWQAKTISVLVAAWRAEAWLDACAASILEQDLPPGWRLELLIGVDGCRDTARVARRIDSPTLQVFETPGNHGTYVMFNTLAARARGMLISRFDADDVMRPGYLTHHIEAATRADIVQSWSVYTDADLTPASRVMAHEFYHPEGGLSRRPSDGQLTLRRRVWETLGAFRPWRCAADTDFLHRARACGFSVEIVEAFLYYRRTHPGALTMQPETRFGGPRRAAYQAFIDTHLPIYQARPETCLVAPVTAGVPAHA